MPNTPTKNLSEIAQTDAYAGQVQPIGGAANTAAPPLVTVTNPGGSGAAPLVSLLNSTTAPLGAGLSFVGAWEDVSPYASITMIGKSDAPGTVYFDYSHDGAVVLLSNQMSTGLTGDFSDIYSSVPAKYFRIRIVNGVAPQTLLAAQTIYYPSARTHIQPISSGLFNNSSAAVGISAGFAVHENLQIWDKHEVTENHALKVEVTSPLNAYGEFVNTELSPSIQLDAVYGLRPTDSVANTGGTGTATASDSLFQCTTGIGVGGYGLHRSVRLLKYYVGLGIRLRGTAQFSPPVPLSLQLFGMFTASDGIFFGYDGVDFGVTRRITGAVAIHRLTISVGATGVENITLTLNGVAFPLGPTPGALSINDTAQFVASKGSLITGWYSNVSPTSNGATVTFLQNTPATTAGAFSMSSSGGARGTFSTIQAGAPNVNLSTPKTLFNVDRLDGSNGDMNPSGMDFDPSFLNVFQIVYPYIGAGPIRYYVVNPETTRMTLCHIDKYSTANHVTSQKNPSFRGGWIAASLGSVTNLTVSGSSLAGFVEGKIEPNRNPNGKEFRKTISNLDEIVIAFRIRNEFGGVVNQSDVNPYTVRVTAETTNRLISYAVYLNPTIPTNVSTTWQYIDRANSVVEFATPTGAAITGGQFISGGGCAGGSSESVLDLSNLGVKIQAGDVFVIAASTVFNTSSATFTTTWQEN